MKLHENYKDKYHRFQHTLVKGKHTTWKEISTRLCQAFENIGVHMKVADIAITIMHLKYVNNFNLVRSNYLIEI